MAGKRKNVRMMRRILKEHGYTPPPRKGCLSTLMVAFLFGATLGLVILGAVFMRPR